MRKQGIPKYLYILPFKTLMMQITISQFLFEEIFREVSFITTRGGGDPGIWGEHIVFGDKKGGTQNFFS